MTVLKQGSEHAAGQRETITRIQALRELFGMTKGGKKSGGA